MALKLKGSTSGFTAIDAPAVAGDNTLVLPANNGSASQFLQTNGSGVLSWQTVTDTNTTGWTMDTTGTSLSGESTVSFTGIPTTATKVILVWEDLSTSANAEWRIRLGHDATFGGFSYHVASGHTGPSASNSQQMTGSFQTFGLADASATLHGVFELDAGTGNYWYGRTHMNHEGNAYIYWMAGYGDGGSNVLDRVALATTSGTFDSGTAYCHYLEA